MLNESELQALNGAFNKPNLEESLDLATRTDPNIAAETRDSQVSSGFYQANKTELDRQKRLFDINSQGLKQTHPKTANWMTDTNNSSVAIDDLDIFKGLEDSLKEPERGFWNNTGRGALKTINQLTGNLIEFAGNVTDDFDDYMVNTLGMPNPGIIFGDDGISMSWNVPPGITGVEEIGKAISEGNVYGYQPRFTWENLKGDVTPTNLAGYVAEQGVQSLPHMLAALYTLPAYIASRTEDIAESRVTNDDRDDVTGEDLATSFVPAVAVALMEKLGAKVTFGAAKVVGAKGVAKAAGVAGATEGATEFIQEGIEYVGETLGTKKDVDLAEMFDRQLAGLVAGTGMGGVIRGSTATIEAIGNRTEQQILTSGQSLSEQQTIDQVVSFAQTSTTNNRAKTNFEEFVNTLGEDREVLIPNEIAEQMVDAPEYIADGLNDLGISISVPLSKFAGEIAVNDEWMSLIRPHIKLSSNMMSQEELDDGNRGEIKELLKRAQENQETITESERIYEAVKDQIIDTKFQGQSTARHSAQLYPAAAAVYAEKARKAGHDVSVSDMYEMMGFRVEAGDVDVDVRPDVILDQMDIPSDLEIEVESEVIETGETISETYNAKELNQEIDDKLDAYKRLRDCLA